ncbi:MAG TPA: signal peptidase II [Abditibacteriaceae bacterium]|nr:signal peptidase II [Abditibacteriaceae bacterium]
MTVETQPAVSHPAVQTGRTPHYLVGFLLIAASVIIADQLSKAMIRATLPLGSEAPLVPGWAHLSHVLNSGAAWGILHGQRFFLIGVTLCVLVVVGLLAREFAARGAMAMSGLGLILGGAVGNLIDRLRFGSVTDFIDLDTPVVWLQRFPVFNLADAALTVGVTLLLIDLLLGGHREAGKRKTKPADAGL